MITELKLEIDYEAAHKLANTVLMQNYLSLRDDGIYDGATDLDALLSAFMTVIEYSTTKDQRVQNGMV